MLSRLLASRQRPYIPHRHERETINIDFSGSRLSLSMPPHACHDSFSYFNLQPPPQVNIFDDREYGDDSEFEDWAREGVASQQLMQRSWELFGPIWRSRPIGTIDFVLTLNRHDSLPENMSCFNPEHFEQIIVRHLYFLGPGQNPDDHVQKAPINWQVRELDGVTGYYFEKHRINPPEILTENPHHDTYFSSYFMFPVSDRHYIVLSFRYLGYAPVESCLFAMNNLRDSVCNSVVLETSEDVDVSLKSARRQWPRAKANVVRDVEPWIYPEWRRAGEFGGKLIITKPGSSPSAWNV